MAEAREIHPSGTVHLPLIVVSRMTTTAIYMTYPACLSVLMGAWNMSATQAGMVQGAFSLAFAVGLVIRLRSVQGWDGEGIVSNRLCL